MTSVTPPREHLLAALEADLIGPYDLPGYGPDTSDELLRLPPSRWYLTGFLAPMEAREVDEPTDDEVAAGPDRDDEDAGSPDAGPKRKHFLPASLGLSVLLPPRPAGGDSIRATVRWADYRAEDVDEDPATGTEPKQRFWRRVPRQPVSIDLVLDAEQLARGVELDDAPGVRLVGRLAEGHGKLEAGTRALAVFLVNRRGAGEKGKADEQFMFQVSLELDYADDPSAAGHR